MTVKMKRILAAAVTLCFLLTGCASPSKIMTYREEDAAFKVEIDFDGMRCKADVTLPLDGKASLVFTYPEEAAGIAVTLDGDMLYIGGGTPIPVKADAAGGTLASLLKVLSSSPSDVHTTVRCEIDGIPVCRCETGDGAVYVVSETGKPLRFVTGKTVADVID